MTGPGWRRAVEHMARNDGLATRAQIRSLGVTDRMVHRRICDGLLIRINGRVLALPGTAADLPTRTRAAVLALPRAVPTGPAAAHLLGAGPWEGLDLGDEPWLIHPRSRGVDARFVSHPGVRTVRAQGLAVAHPRTVVVDLIRMWPRDRARTVAERALQLRTVTLEDLSRSHAALGRRAGNAQLADVIRTLADGTRSEGERRLAGLLREAGFVGWIANHGVAAGARWYEIDIAFPQERLALEVDGRAFHSDSTAFQRDRRRQNDLVAAGWTVLRFTWSDITDRPEETLGRIARALDALSGR
jgi:very-short-patch-repair endonuclease